MKETSAQTEVCGRATAIRGCYSICLLKKARSGWASSQALRGMSPCLKGSSITESSVPDGARAGVQALPQSLFKTNQSLQPLNGQGGGPLDVQGLGQIL